MSQTLVPELAFDVVLHLVGEQVVPNYMAIKLCDAKRHVMVVTTKTKAAAERIVAALPERDLSLLEVVPTDYREIKAKLSSFLADQADGRIGFNITGGTKPMSVTALDVCRSLGVVPFYLDTEDHRILFFTDEFKSVGLPPVFTSVGEYVRLAGYAVSCEGKTPQDVLTVPVRRFLREAWLHRNLLQMFVDSFANAKSRRDFEDVESRFEGRVQCSGGAAVLWSEWRSVYEELDSWAKMRDLGKGMWLEQWLLRQFSDVGNPRIIDLRMGVSVKALQGSDRPRDLQEIDVAFTDGYCLYLLECKAGHIEQSYVQKLENIRRGLGGSFGVGILCSLNDPDEILLERVSLGSIACVSGQALESLPRNVFSVQGRTCYRTAKDFGK